MKKVMLIFMFSICARADLTVDGAWKACQKPKEAGTCKLIQNTADNVEKMVEMALKNIIMKDVVAVVTTSTANAIIQRKVKLKGSRWEQLISNDQFVIEIDEDAFRLGLKWRF